MANGNDGRRAPANEPEADPGRISLSILSRDRVNSIKNFMGSVGHVSVAIVVFLVPICLAYLFLRPESEGSGGAVVKAMDWLEKFLLGTSSEGSEKSETAVLIRLKNLLTEPAFYYSIAALSGVYLGWRWWLYVRLRKEFETRKEPEDKSDLTTRDWWVVQGLRERALAFRTLAGVLLSGVVAVLLGGIYLILFVLPQVPPSDLLQVQEIQRENVKRQFGHRLQLIGEGRYWFKVAEVGRETPTSEEWGISDLLKTANARLAEMALPAGATLSRLPVLNTYEASKNEYTILAVGHGEALVTRDGGETWSVPKGLASKDSALEETEWITAATFDADGRFGVIGGTEGSVFVTQDGGETWNIPEGLMLNEDEWIVVAAYGPDGRPGVVGGVEGSVFVTQDSGGTWSAPKDSEGKDLALEKTEWIITAAFDAASRFGVVAGDEGSVFVTQDGGETWNVPEGLMLNEDEWIVAAAFGANNTYGVVSNNKGLIFLTQDSGGTWSAPKDSEGKDLALEETEWIIMAAFDAASRFGVVAGDEGSVFVTQDGGKTWSDPESLVLKGDERIITAAFDAAGRFGVVAGDEGSVFVTQDGGKTWSDPENLVLKGDERIITAAFDATSRFGIVAGDEGSVFVTQDGGKAWSKSGGLKLKESERIVAAAFSTDGKHGVVAGGKGSVFETQSSGESWISAVWDYQGTSNIDVVNAIPGGRHFVAVDDDGRIHLLKAYPDMVEWENRSLVAMRSRIQEDEILRESVIGQEIVEYLDRAPSTDRNIAGGEDSKPSNVITLPSLLDEITVMRGVTLIVLFFLVQILVRLYQYSLRLAAFWDARADAVLLAQSFACHSAETFYDLVAALAPDAYDFKPSPKSGHESMMNLADQLLRRESRKS